MKIVVLNKSRSFGGRPIPADEPEPVSDDLARLIVARGYGEIDEAATAKAAERAAAETAKPKPKPKAKRKAKPKPKAESTK